jgi:alkylation response protein AidB-like acyl-CoA dehydrogenase
MFDTLAFSAIPEEDEALRPAIRRLIEDTCKTMRPVERARTWMGVDRDFSRAMGKAGFLGLTIPKAYGGQGRGPFARFVVVEELLSFGAPVGLHWIADRQSALVILNYGTEEQKKFYLPKICAGEIFFCIGMSEPSAGSDLASVKSRAERTSSGWCVNGHKIWTTNAHLGDYAIALLRTSGDASLRHAGLSQLIIPLNAKGVTVRPIRDVNGDEDFTEIFLDNVELPADALLGAEGAGWEQVNAELAFERSGPERIYSSLVVVDLWIRHVQQSGTMPDSRLRLAGGLMARLGTLREIAIGTTALLARGEKPLLEASLLKDLGTTFEQSIPHLIADDLAAFPDDPVDPEFRAALVHLMQIAPAFSLRGGTREVMRGIIARGLGLR